MTARNMIDAASHTPVTGVRSRTRRIPASGNAGLAASEVIRQRNDSRVEVLLAADRASGSWWVPADAIDAITARAMGIQRPPRNRRTSGAVPLPTSRYEKGPGSH
jgi:hypothetical protein